MPVPRGNMCYRPLFSLIEPNLGDTKSGRMICISWRDLFAVITASMNPTQDGHSIGSSAAISNNKSQPPPHLNNFPSQFGNLCHKICQIKSSVQRRVTLKKGCFIAFTPGPCGPNKIPTDTSQSEGLPEKALRGPYCC